MKRPLAWLLIFGLMFSLAACGNSENSMSTGEVPVEESRVPSSAADSGDKSSAAASGESNILVAYYTWADNAILADDVDAVTSPSVIPPGNVQQLAGWVQEQTGADTFSIRVNRSVSQ